MNTIVIHDGPADQALALTSLIPGLYKAYGIHPITWVTRPENAVFYQRQKGVKVEMLGSAFKMDGYDCCICYGGNEKVCSLGRTIEAKHSYGVYSTQDILDLHSWNLKNAQHAQMVLLGQAQTRQNMFQILYQMAGLTWRGESYAFRYFPKAKGKNNVVGVAVGDEKVRTYIKHKLEVFEDRLWHVPIKKDPTKQFDEVNKCDNIITDDPFVMHVAVALRKHVEYLLYTLPNMRMEFFGNGHCHLVPDDIKGLSSPLNQETHREEQNNE